MQNRSHKTEVKKMNINELQQVTGKTKQEIVNMLRKEETVQLDLTE